MNLMSDIDSTHLAAICNGDLLFPDIIAEDWLGIRSCGPTKERWNYQLYPRAVYYAFKEVNMLNPQRIFTSVDSVPGVVKYPEDLTLEWVPDHPFFMILNVAVGGDYVGFPTSDTPFPQTMYVDPVRIYTEVKDE